MRWAKCSCIWYSCPDVQIADYLRINGWSLLFEKFDIFGGEFCLRKRVDNGWRRGAEALQSNQDEYKKAVFSFY